MKEQNLTPIIKDSFRQFAGAVLQSRALVDVRDCIKPSARQIFYCLYTDKFVHSKPFQKTLKAIGSAFRMYIHGDSSAEGIIMRAGQPFSMRYPLVEVEGSYGTLLASSSWSAPRYTGARLSELAEYLFTDINKNTVDEWRDNYDDTEQYPAILPSKGFFNLVNGTYGIGVGASSSIPQYNLKEINNALITLIKNPSCDFEEIYCTPDFATGGIIINADEVKESHRNGTGRACKIRSVVEWDSANRCLIVKEIPYMTYTETICKELEDIINSESNPGIERFNDLTGENPLIKIYLNKKANPDRILKFLYKNTSLENYYGINFTMLDNGRFPKVFTWKEVLQAHIDHEKIIYKRAYEFDLQKILFRIHIIEGLLKCCDNIDEVVRIIKNSSSTQSASKALCANFNLDEDQVKAVLNMKLSRLANLEVQKLHNEKSNLEVEKNKIEEILSNETLFNQQLINGWEEVSKKFGDARRSKILNLKEDDGEIIEEKSLSISFTNKNAVFVTDTSTLYSQKRNTVGAKFKLDKGEFIVDNITGKSTDKILFFTNKGQFYPRNLSEFIVGEKQYLDIDEVRAATIVSTNNKNKNIVFITQNGIIKKSRLTEYNLKRNIGSIALKLDTDDQVISVMVMDDEDIGILTKCGNLVWIDTKTIKPIGRTTRGIKAISLKENDLVVNAHIIPKTTKELLSITLDGYWKRTSIQEFRKTGRGTKGVGVQKSNVLCDFLAITDNNDILVISTKSQLRVKINEIPLSTRGAIGVKSIKMDDYSEIIALEKCNK